ncbi:hypothetical protein [Streptomyces sasae]|uniref:hypothetical protein n=1 Tax=Streptomyces sasae TaxID=1266772 RepID=UPI0029317DAE|nr:hypothetical protein [Streptomyces sasae]
MCTAFRNNDFAELTSLLDEGRTRITSHAHKRAISEAIRALNAVRTTGTVGDVLDLMTDGHLLAMPGKLKDGFGEPLPGLHTDKNPSGQRWGSFASHRAVQSLCGYRPAHRP